MKINLLLLFVLASITASAEPDKKAPPVFFRTFGIGGVASDLVYLDGATPKPITIDDERRSAFYEFAGSPGPVVFARMVPGPDGKPVPKEVSRAVLPPPDKRFLLLFQKQPGDDGWAIRVLPDGVESVPPGGYRFLNYLESRVGIVLGENKHLIEPGASWTSEGRPTSGKVVFKVQVFKVPGETAVNVYSNIWALEASKRHLILIVPSAENPSGVEVRRLSEDVNTIPADKNQPTPQS